MGGNRKDVDMTRQRDRRHSCSTNGHAREEPKATVQRNFRPTGTLGIASLPTDQVGSRQRNGHAGEEPKATVQRKSRPTGTLGIASLPTDQVGSRQRRSIRRRG